MHACSKFSIYVPYERIPFYIQCPMFRREEDKEVPEQFADEAKFFTESRLLQRDVHIILEGVSNANFLGTVQHPVSSTIKHLLH